MSLDEKQWNNAKQLINNMNLEQLYAIKMHANTCIIKENKQW